MLWLRHSKSWLKALKGHAFGSSFRLVQFKAFVWLSLNSIAQPNPLNPPALPRPPYLD